MSLEAIPLHDVPRFPIEEGHIMMFARALGDPNPIYRDPEYARRSELLGIIAPPTFVEAAMHFDDEGPFRPRVGERWWGSASQPRSAPPPLESSGTSFHASTRFDYHGAVRPGIVLCARSRRSRTWDKSGRSGRLHFVETITEYLDGFGDLLVTRTQVAVTTERKVALPPAPAARLGTASWRPGDRPASYPVRELSSTDLAVGSSFSELLVDDLPRAQIQMYAGASGDFAPQHLDEPYATQVEGYPTVFAHGMLTMGMTGRLITDWIGDGRLVSFAARFEKPVWAGDSLTGQATVSRVHEVAGDATVHLDIETLNQVGRAVLTGSATVRVAAG